MKPLSPRLHWLRPLRLAPRRALSPLKLGWHHPYLSSLLVLLLGMALSFLAFASIWESRQETVSAEFDRQALDHADVIKAAFERRLVVVESIAAFFGTNQEITREQFADLSQPLLERFPALSALFWVPGVPENQLARFENRTRQSIPGYEVYGAGSAVESLRYPILFIEPLAANTRALGFDLASEPCYRELLDKAGDRDETVGCRLDAQPLAADGRSLVILRSVYEESTVASEAAQRAEPVGFAGAVFRVSGVVERSLKPLRPSGIDLVIFDTSGPLEQRFIYFHPSRLRPDFVELRDRQALEEWIPTKLDFEVPFSIGGGAWIIKLSPAPGFFETGPGWEGWSTLLGGISFSGLLAFYLFSVRRRSTALADANDALGREMGERHLLEQALFAEKERAEVTLNSIGDAVISVTREGRIDFLNPTAEALTGWPLPDAKGRPLDEVFRVIDELSRHPLPDPVGRCLREGHSVELAQRSALLGRGGQEYAIHAMAAPIRGRRQEVLGAVLTFRDVTQARRSAQQMAHRAAHDPLTGLLNRREFEHRLHKAIASARRYRAAHALCYIDLDHFKAVNDTAGHMAGDELLKTITGVLASDIRDRDTLARLGGDEFALLLDNCPLEKAVEIAETLIAAVRNLRFAWGGRTFELGASIGLVPITGTIDDANELLREADTACYTAKALGRNQVHIYQQEQDRARAPAQVTVRAVEAAGIREALDEERFELFAQPIAALNQAPTACYELLLRMRDSAGNMLLPSVFLPTAERYGLMANIDRWVIRNALSRYSLLAAELPSLEFTINLSSQSLADESLLAYLQDWLGRGNIPANRICFEISETTAVHNLGQTSRFIGEAKKLGVRFALDRFGGGPTSLWYLRRLPVDFLKIDGRYAREIDASALNQAVVKAFIQIGRAIGVKTVAEYAESAPAVEKLRELGVDFVQGFGVGRPAPLSALGRQTT